MTPTQALGPPSKPATGRRWRRWCLLLLAPLLCLAYAGAAAVMYFNQDHIIFPGADRPRPAAPGPTEPGVEQVWITSDDGCRVEAWFKPGRGRTAMAPGPAVMYFHGNNDSVDTGWWVARHNVENGISTLVVENRGYGRAEGHPAQQAIVADAIRFYDGLAIRPEVDARRIYFHGSSLGGAVAVAVAEHRQPAALVLECTFTSMEAMAHRYGMPGFLCRHPFRTDRVLPTLDIPIAIFHGRRDDFIPVTHARRLHELAPRARYVELDCGHDDFHNDWQNIRAFLVEAGLLP